jgi:DNA-binding transcriptional LysR family regulator
MVNLELYKVFYTVAKCGSLTRAAEELYISQPAVSQSIKQLESQLGVTLFNRTHRGMELSAQGGKAIFAKVEQALRLFKDAELIISQINTKATGTIRIGASDTIFEYLLADKIVEFHEKYPGVKIELLSDVTPRTLEDLKRDACDVAFVNLPIEPDPALRLYGNIMRLSEVFITSGEKYPELIKGKIPLSELEKYPLVTLEDNTVATVSLKRFLSSVGVTLTPSIQTGSWDMMKRLVGKGMGVGVIPREYIKRCLEDETLQIVEVDPVMPVRSVGMVLLKDKQIPYALRAFIELFNLKV